jgi:hypothetical protein
MNYHAASRGYQRELFLFADSGWELTPKDIKYLVNKIK